MVEICTSQHLMCVWESKRNVWVGWCADISEVGFEAEVGQVADARLVVCGKSV